MKKLRLTYAAIFLLLLFTEIYIGLYVHDNFIRPYIGDVLVTILICCLCRTVIPKGVSALPIFVFVFATLVEFAQYFEIVKVLGLENNRLLSTIIGTSFSPIDLICYGVGCLIFWVAEKTVKFREFIEKSAPLDLTNPDAVVTVTNMRNTETPFGPSYRGCCAIKEDLFTSACFQTIDGSDMRYEQPHRCYVNFLTPKAYPHTLWIGRKIELYEGKLLVGIMRIEQINNPLLDRNIKFADHAHILSDEKVLNIALKRHLEWGRKFQMPLDNKLMRSIPPLSGNDIEKVSQYVDQVRDDVLWKIYYDHFDSQTQILKIDGMKTTSEKYPWINKRNLASLESQGMYYAWHG